MRMVLSSPQIKTHHVYPKISTQLSISLLHLCPGVLYGCRGLSLVFYWTLAPFYHRKGRHQGALAP